MNNITFIDKKRITKVEVVNKRINREFIWRDEKICYFLFWYWIKTKAGFYSYGYWDIDGVITTIHNTEDLENKYIVEDKVVYYKPFVRILTIDNNGCSTNFDTFEEALVFAKSIISEDFIEVKIN